VSLCVALLAAQLCHRQVCVLKTVLGGKTALRHIVESSRFIGAGNGTVLPRRGSHLSIILNEHFEEDGTICLYASRFRCTPLRGYLKQTCVDGPHLTQAKHQSPVGCDPGKVLTLLSIAGKRYKVTNIGRLYGNKQHIVPKR
jgi:hypothetical protein